MVAVVLGAQITLRAWGLVAGAATVVGLAAAALLVGATLRGWYQRTIGRTRSNHRRIQRLGTNAQASFFAAVLGSPPALRKTFHAAITMLPNDAGNTGTDAAYRTRIALFYNEFLNAQADDESQSRDEREATTRGEVADQVTLESHPVELSELVWVDGDYYVQALVDVDETVLAFSVTARRRRFRPTFFGAGRPNVWQRVRMRVTRRPAGAGALFRLQLGKTCFARIGSEPRAVYGGQGFHRYAYYEAHWFGNPGLYQHFVFTSNDAGTPAWQNLEILFGPGGLIRWSSADAASLDEISGLQEYRRRTAPNTYTVIGPRFHFEDYPISFGPELNEVRTLA